jgi:hypothetical protein
MGTWEGGQCWRITRKSKKFKPPLWRAVEAIDEVILSMDVLQCEPKLPSLLLQVPAAPWCECLAGHENSRCAFAAVLLIGAKTAVKVSDDIASRGAHQGKWCSAGLPDCSVHARVAATAYWNKSRVAGTKQVSGTAFEEFRVERLLQTGFDRSV